MACKYCRRDFGHDYRCPFYVDHITIHKCDICGKGILNGEEYIINNNKCAHIDCFDTTKEVLKWLDCEVIKEILYEE